MKRCVMDNENDRMSLPDLDRDDRLLDNTEQGHCGIVAIVGRANVGKSTVLNALVGEKVSIVSPVVQTTRNLIRAILSESRGQLVFLDTPGVHKASHDLGRIMNRAARSSVEGADAALLVLDTSAPPRQEDDGWMHKLANAEADVVLLLNKIDLGARHETDYRALWEEAARDRAPELAEATWLTASATNGDGIGHLLDTLFEHVPKGPRLFPEDILTDFPRKIAMADVVREKLFLVLRQELPHEIAVLVRMIDDDATPREVYADIYVNKPTQKGIVIGKKGRLLKRVREQSEREIAEMFGHPVRINLWVKVEKHWARNYLLLRQMGYV